MEKTLKEQLEFLGRNRRVNDLFIARLKKVGFKIEFEKYLYWDGQPFIGIGNCRVWLVGSRTKNNQLYCINRYQKDVCEELKDIIEEQISECQTDDNWVDWFFENLKGKEGGN